MIKLTILDRYIGVHVWVNFAISLSALLAVFSVINTLQELELVGTGHYGLAQAAWVVAMTIPVEAYGLFPAAALIGGITALGLLAGHNELAPIWSAGISPWRLVSSVMKAAGVLVVAAAILGEIVAAPLAQQAGVDRSIATTGGMAMSTAKGFWARDGSRYLNIRALPGGDELHDVHIYDFDDQHRLETVTHADSATYAGDEWHLREVVESRLAEDGVHTESTADRLVPGFVTQTQLRLLLSQPEYLSLADLWKSIGSLQKRGESSRRYELALWKRMTMPFASAVMIFLSVPFVLVAATSRKSGERIAVGAFLGIGFRLFDETFGQVSLIYGISPLIGATLPAFTALILALWLMRKAT